MFEKLDEMATTTFDPALVADDAPLAAGKPARVKKAAAPKAARSPYKPRVSKLAGIGNVNDQRKQLAALYNDYRATVGDVLQQIVVDGVTYRNQQPLFDIAAMQDVRKAVGNGRVRKDFLLAITSQDGKTKWQHETTRKGGTFKADRAVMADAVYPVLDSIMEHRHGLQGSRRLTRDLDHLQVLKHDIAAARVTLKTLEQKHANPTRRGGKRAAALVAAIAAVAGMATVEASPALTQDVADMGNHIALSLGFKPKAAPVQKAQPAVVLADQPVADARALGSDPYDPSTVDGALKLVNNFKVTPGTSQQKLVAQLRELHTAEASLQAQVASPAFKAKHAEYQAQLSKVQAQIAVLPTPKYNRRDVALVAARHAVQTVGTFTKGALTGRTPEQNFGMLVAFNRLESFFTPDVCSGPYINSPCGLGQDAPSVMFAIMAPHMDAIADRDEVGSFKTLQAARDRIVDHYAQTTMGTQFRRNPAATRKKILASRKLTQDAYGAAADDMKWKMHEALVDNTEIVIGGDKTTAGAYLSNVATLLLANERPDVPKVLLDQYGFETMNYMYHNLGAHDFQNFVRHDMGYRAARDGAAKTAEMTAYTHDIAGLANGNPAVYKVLTPTLDARGQPVPDKSGHPTMHLRLMTPEETLKHVETAYFGDLPKAAETIATAGEFFNADGMSTATAAFMPADAASAEARHFAQNAETGDLMFAPGEKGLSKVQLAAATPKPVELAAAKTAKDESGLNLKHTQTVAARKTKAKSLTLTADTVTLGGDMPAQKTVLSAPTANVAPDKRTAALTKFATSTGAATSRAKPAKSLTLAVAQPASLTVN